MIIIMVRIPTRASTIITTGPTDTRRSTITITVVTATPPSISITTATTHMLRSTIITIMVATVRERTTTTITMAEGAGDADAAVDSGVDPAGWLALTALRKIEFLLGDEAP